MYGEWKTSETYKNIIIRPACGGHYRITPVSPLVSDRLGKFVAEFQADGIARGHPCGLNGGYFLDIQAAKDACDEDESLRCAGYVPDRAGDSAATMKGAR